MELGRHRIVLIDEYASEFCECDHEHFYQHGELMTKCEECGEEIYFVRLILQEQYEPKDDGKIYIDDFPSGSPQCFICCEYHFDSGFDLAGDFDSEGYTISIVQHPENEKWFIAICEECRDEHKIFTKGVYSCIQDYAKTD